MLIDWKYSFRALSFPQFPRSVKSIFAYLVKYSAPCVTSGIECRSVSLHRWVKSRPNWKQFSWPNWQEKLSRCNLRTIPLSRWKLSPHFILSVLRILWGQTLGAPRISMNSIQTVFQLCDLKCITFSSLSLSLHFLALGRNELKDRHFSAQPEWEKKS